MRALFTLFLCLFGFSLSAQSIVNTELILKDIDSTSAVNIYSEGDLKFGNIHLVEVNNQLTYGAQYGKNLLRLSVGHEFLEENGEKLANDLVGQARLNHFLGKNSVFVFVQAQNTISLNLKLRYLFGAGYRQNIISSGDSSSQDRPNYLDLSAGIFKELEEYTRKGLDNLNIDNWRYSISAFSNVTITQKLSLNTTIYYQLNQSNLEDYRIYIEPRLYYKLDKISLYLTNRYRYHSTPYVPVKKEDQEYLFGVEISL